MAINNFKPFALDPNANVTSQADWEALPALLSGFTAGKASSAQVNKAIRQASFIAAALAQYTANKSGLDVLDDGDLNGFISKMGTAFGKDFQALDATLSALAGLATGANKLPYFTGNDTAAQTDLTSVGRDIIGKNTIADILTYLGLDRIEQLSIETKIKSPGGGTYLFVDENKWGCFVSGTGNLALGIEYGGTGANTASGALTKLGIGPIASAAEVTSGTPKKLVDAERLVGAIATDSDIQSATVKKLVDAAGLINAITTMQDIRDGALRKLVNAQSLKNYLPTKALGASGFIRIPDVPGGTIIQWGQVVKSITEGLENVVLPTPFPTSGRFAIAIPLNQSGNSSIDIIPHLVAASQTGINFYFSWGTTSTPANGFQWLALGY